MTNYIYDSTRFLNIPPNLERQKSSPH